jgi:hypothetical protein
MKRRHVITAAAAVLAAIGLGTGLGLGHDATAATGTAATTSSVTTTSTVAKTSTAAPSSAAARRPHYVVLDCGFKPQVRPATYVWTCADYGTGIQDMHWTSWTRHLASGYGTFWENDCTPNCAAGKIIDYPVLATFWGSAKVPGHPADRRYTELTLVFTGKRPPVYNGPGKPTYPLTQTFETNYDHS